jgi:hypothetical protein
MASSTELDTDVMYLSKKSLLDLPSETIALILENVGRNGFTRRSKPVEKTPDIALRQQTMILRNYVECQRLSEN